MKVRLFHKKDCRLVKSFDQWGNFCAWSQTCAIENRNKRIFSANLILHRHLEMVSQTGYSSTFSLSYSLQKLPITSTSRFMGNTSMRTNAGDSCY
ncbi:hypothetical protein BC939DRAFT_469158 [Gamsiella multidivaricata]|uniref:uncharacterized protein n=1 Tax=Gamsiella multidivaricata TaxID=101098 RepID=UPI002220717C|nr:uncharacterized protein BC939DRAFT_469158 [Gamsiella multidivaricata]KAI7816429.1 hypothetical protein BC939DRAFT_469158 [Gamsiella multidivaricata]